MKNYFEEIGAWPRAHKIALSYIIGFLLSLALTLTAYDLVVDHALAEGWLIAAIVIAALVQFVVQIYCFLHIVGDESSKDRLVGLGFASIVVSILVSGSLWIMWSMNSRMMPGSAQMEQYMEDQGGF